MRAATGDNAGVSTRLPVPALRFTIVAIAIGLCSSTLFFYFRDNFSTHYPVKVYSAAVMRGGDIPFWNFAAGGGQPLAGNPNTLTFYPDNLLYLIFSPMVAFNLHFLLHLVAAFFTMRALARLFGATQTNAGIASGIYLLSGVAMSCLAFYNFVTALALVPLVLLTAEQLLAAPTLRSGLLLGASCGLLALGTEPVTIFGTAIIVLILGAGRLTWAGLRQVALAALVACAIASPLFISYGEIAGEVERGMHTYSARTVLAASLRPERLLEMLIGPYLGLALDYGETGYRTGGRAGGWPPFFPSLLIGGIAAASLIAGGAPRMRLKAAAGALLFIALGRFNPIMNWLVERFELFRALRYPEKLSLHITILIVLLISIWLATTDLRKREIVLLRTAGALLLVVLVAALIGQVVPPPLQLRTIAGTAIAAATLFAAQLRSPTRRNLAVLLLTFPLLAYWAARAAPVDFARHYREEPALLAAVASPVWRTVGTEPLELAEPHARARYRIAAAMLDPLFGTSFGVAYTFDRSPDGMYSGLSRIVNERMSAAPAWLQSRYLRLTGTRTVLTRSPAASPGMARLGSIQVNGNELHAYRVADPLPMVFPVRGLAPVGSIQQAVRTIEHPGFDERKQTVGPLGRKIPTGAVTVNKVALAGQKVLIEVDAPEAGLLLINQSYFSAWSASNGGQRLETVPLNLDRLGVIVPAGSTDIVLQFGRRHTLVALSWFLSMALVLASLVVALRSKKATAAPARYSEPQITTAVGSSDSA